MPICSAQKTVCFEDKLSEIIKFLYAGRKMGVQKALKNTYRAKLCTIFQLRFYSKLKISVTFSPTVIVEIFFRKCYTVCPFLQLRFNDSKEKCCIICNHTYIMYRVGRFFCINLRFSSVQYQRIAYSSESEIRYTVINIITVRNTFLTTVFMFYFCVTYFGCLYITG